MKWQIANSRAIAGPTANLLKAALPLFVYNKLLR